MDRMLRERRNHAAERHDAALARYPTRQGEAFKRELRAVVDELSTITVAADVPLSDPVEVAKAYRWLGDACFDLGQGRDNSSLIRGDQAYQRAEQLLADSEAPLEMAKLDFNYGNTLRGLSQGVDVGLLEAAQTRYEKAVRAFRAHRLPDLAATVEDQLKSIDPQLRLARKRAEVERGQQRLQQLAERVQDADAVERDSIEKELKELGDLRRRGGITEALDEALVSLEEQKQQHPERFGDALSKLDTLKESVTSLESMLADAQTTRSTKARPDPEEELLQLLQGRLQKEKEQGRVSEDRADQLASILQQFGEAMVTDGEDLASLGRKADKMHQLARRAMDQAMTPSWSTPDPEPGSRAHALVTILDPLKRHLLGEKGRAMQPAEERDAATDLLIRLSKLEMRIREASAKEERVTEIEGEVWRLAIEVQEYARRHHVVLAQPVFAVTRSHAKPLSLFLSGRSELLALAETLAERYGLEVLSRPLRGDYAQERWNQLCSAGVAVFDLGTTRELDLAQVCYELGMALALGKTSVIVASPNTKIPFDVNLRPVLLPIDQNVDRVERLDLAIQQALGSIVWGGSEAGLGQGKSDALTWLDRRIGPRLSEGTLGIARRLVEQNKEDAAAFRRTLNQLLGSLGADAPTIFLSAWPPVYPKLEETPHCFHVMPFSMKWSDACRDYVRTLCRRQGWKYSRGDEADEQRIIRGIWTEIGQASAVLVDITGNNPNVALELGLVHALGRPYRVVSQDSPEKARFSNLEKIQVHYYGKAPAFKGLEEIVRGFLV